MTTSSTNNTGYIDNQECLCKCPISASSDRFKCSNIGCISDINGAYDSYDLCMIAFLSNVCVELPPP